MVAGFVISLIAYGAALWVNMLHPEKVGNILNVCGIIWSAIFALVSFSLGIEGNTWGYVFALVHLAFMVVFCIMLDYVSKKVDTYRKEKGLPIHKKLRKKLTATIFAILLGSFGAHKFYLGRKTAGALYSIFFFTFIPGLLGIIEGIRYATMSQEEFDLRYNDYILSSIQPENKEEEPSGIRIMDIPLEIGSASVKETAGDELEIAIEISGDKTYLFYTAGTTIVSYKIKGQSSRTDYEEV